MTILKKLFGRILNGIAQVLTKVFDVIIGLVENIVLLVRGFFKGFFALLSAGGCLFFILFAQFGFMILLNPVALFTIITLLMLPTMGAKFVAYLKYLKYITTKYLFNTAKHYGDEKKYKYIAFNEYKVAYKKAQEEKKREQYRRYQEQQRRYQEQQQEWFRQWQQQGYQGQGGFGGFGGGQGAYGQGFANPGVDFKGKYERSCEVLGVPTNVDKNQIKNAYRKMAKEYHPDLNKDPNATKMFQEIKDAYEFLSDDSNLQRYRTL